MREQQYFMWVRDSGRVAKDSMKSMARALRDYWGGVMEGWGAAVVGCQHYLSSLLILERARWAVPLLFRKLTE